MASSVNLVRTVQGKDGLQEEHKEAYVGFSWTTFFFGPFVPLFRGDFKWFLIMLVGLFTFGILNIVFAFTYNKIYTNNLVAKGYKPADETSKLFMLNAGIRV